MESLLAADDGAKSFLESPAMVWDEGPHDPEAFSIEGRRLGPYYVQALLGTGGMGRVYRARDTKLNRDVALKLLPRVMELRFFAGLNIDEAAEALGVSPATVEREWAMARAWLYRHLSSRA